VAYDLVEDLDKARACTDQALSVAARLGFGFPIGLANAGEYLIRQGEIEAAIARLSAALELARRYSLRDVLATLGPIIGLAVALGDFPRAARLRGYVATNWAGAGFEGSASSEDFTDENVARLRTELGASFEKYFSAGASMRSQDAIALAQEVTNARWDAGS
jgi:hypothetical protein